MDVAGALAQLLDRQAIVSLIHAYCDRFDRNDPEGVAALFTADATVDWNPDTPTVAGRDLAR